MNEHVGYSEPDEQYDVLVGFLLFFIYVSFLHFFILKKAQL